MPRLSPVLAAGGTHHWGGVRIDWTFELGDGWDLDDASNVLLVPFVGDRVVVLRLSDGHSPVGGTLEPGEHWCVTATRELMQEAGARLLASTGDRPMLHPIGFLRCRSYGTRPFRPHLPHPFYTRVVAWCDVEIVGPPTIPEGGEQVDDVVVVDLDEAAKLLHPVWAALYGLGAELRARGVSDATWTRDIVRLLEEHYLRAPRSRGSRGSTATRPTGSLRVGSWSGPCTTTARSSIWAARTAC